MAILEKIGERAPYSTKNTLKLYQKHTKAELPIQTLRLTPGKPTKTAKKPTEMKLSFRFRSRLLKKGMKQSKKKKQEAGTARGICWLKHL